MPVALAVFFGGSYLIWLKQFAYWRYFATLELLAPTLILGTLLMLFRTPRIAAVTTVWCLILVVATLRPADWGRGGWSDGNYFQVTPPALEAEENVLAIMVAEVPSHVIPFFPGNVRFVRIEGNIDQFRVGPNGTDLVETKLQQEMHQVIREHSGPFYLLALKKDRYAARDRLKQYELEEIPGPSIQVAKMFGDPDWEIEWVPLRRVDTDSQSERQ